MKFVLELSLERFALVKIVSALWNQNDVRDSMAKFYVHFCESDRFEIWQIIEAKVIEKVEWQEIEDRVIEKVLQFAVPEPLKRKIESCVRPIGLQILKLIVYYCEGRYLVNLPLEIHWTPEGIINRKKTVEKLIDNENLDITVRFKLACIFCLEDSIFELWNKMSENHKESFLYTGVEIYTFWKIRVEENSNSNIYGNQYLFESSALSNNKTMAEYFLPKLTPREREQSLIKTAKEIEDADVLCFLLSQMNEEQQIQVFKYNPYKVLRFFLYWPFQSFFIEIADYVWGFLYRSHYSKLLLNIIVNIKLGYKDWPYQNLFEKFWKKSPSAFKSYIIDSYDYTDLLPGLLQIKDKENFKLIFQELSLAERKKMFDCFTMKNIFQCLFFEEDWDLLRFIVEKCLPSEGKRKKFKKKFEMQHSIKSYLGLAENKQKWDQLFLYLDDLTCKCCKRKCATYDSKVKRLCCAH